MKKKNVRRRFGAMAAGLALLLALAACGADVGPGDIPEPDPPGTSFDDKAEIEKPDEPDIGKNTEPVLSGRQKPVFSQDDLADPAAFETELQAYLDDACGMAGTSYMVSPASFRAALCLAIEGANGDTYDGLLTAAKFETDQDMSAWYEGLLYAQSMFNYARDMAGIDGLIYGEAPVMSDMSFDIANAVWDNLDFDGDFRTDYMSSIQEKYNATAAASRASHITDDVNAWCDEQTNGMIPAIANDLSQSSSVLANALYIKSGWTDAFSDSYTESGNFTRSDGSTVKLDFMRQTDKFRYYCDPDGREYAMFGLDGGLWLTVCLDQNVTCQDLCFAMNLTESTRLDVRMPKLDLETSLEAGQLIGYLEQQGAGIAMTDFADFSKMTDLAGGWHIGDIIQKTRLKTDEDGLEAAAVTAIAVFDNAMVDEPQEVIEFYMDRPFSFLITYGAYSESDLTIPTILFFGRYAG